MPLGPSDIRDQKEYERSFIHLFVELQTKGKINPNYRIGITNIEKLLLYADNSAKSINALDAILHNDIRSFLNNVRQYQITENIFMTLYGEFLLHQFLRFYAILENALITMLLGATYGKKGNERIDGTETLGRLLCIIDNLYPSHKLRTMIDHDFRNILAHGWYYLENDKLVYFEDATLARPNYMELSDFLLKFRRLDLCLIALIQVTTHTEWGRRNQR